MTEIDTSVDVIGHGGGKFKINTSYPAALPPCYTLVDKTKLEGELVVYAIHTDNNGETKITDKKIGKEKKQ